MLVCFSVAAHGGLVMHSSVYLMAEGLKHVGTHNICGGIDNSSGTLETLVYEMRALDFSQYKKPIKLV
jgi:hypothetical protein